MKRSNKPHGHVAADVAKPPKSMALKRRRLVGSDRGASADGVSTPAKLTALEAPSVVVLTETISADACHFPEVTVLEAPSVVVLTETFPPTFAIRRNVMVLERRRRRIYIDVSDDGGGLRGVARIANVMVLDNSPVVVSAVINSSNVADLADIDGVRRTVGCADHPDAAIDTPELSGHDCVGSAIGRGIDIYAARGTGNAPQIDGGRGQVAADIDRAVDRAKAAEADRGRGQIPPISTEPLCVRLGS